MLTPPGRFMGLVTVNNCGFFASPPKTLTAARPPARLTAVNIFGLFARALVSVMVQAPSNATDDEVKPANGR